MLNTRIQYPAGECSCGSAVMETYEDPAIRCACGELVCVNC